MSEYINDFIEFFDLADLFSSTTITVQNAIGLSIVAFIGCIFTIMGVRCVFELIKIVTDWSRFK